MVVYGWRIVCLAKPRQQQEELAMVKSGPNQGRTDVMRHCNETLKRLLDFCYKYFTKLTPTTEHWDAPRTKLMKNSLLNDFDCKTLCYARTVLN